MTKKGVQKWTPLWDPLTRGTPQITQTHFGFLDEKKHRFWHFPRHPQKWSFWPFLWFLALLVIFCRSKPDSSPKTWWIPKISGILDTPSGPPSPNHSCITRWRSQNRDFRGVQNDPFWSLLGLFLTPFLTHYIQDLGGKNGVKRPKRGSQKGVILGVKNDPILVIFGPPQRGPKSGHFGTFWHVWKRVIFGVILDTPLKPPYFR